MFDSGSMSVDNMQAAVSVMSAERDVALRRAEEAEADNRVKQAQILQLAEDLGRQQARTEAAEQARDKAVTEAAVIRAALKQALATPGPGTAFLTRHREIVQAARILVSYDSTDEQADEANTRLRALLEQETEG